MEDVGRLSFLVHLNPTCCSCGEYQNGSCLENKLKSGHEKNYNLK